MLWLHYKRPLEVTNNNVTKLHLEVSFILSALSACFRALMTPLQVPLVFLSFLLCFCQFGVFMVGMELHHRRPLEVTNNVTPYRFIQSSLQTYELVPLAVFEEFPIHSGGIPHW